MVEYTKHLSEPWFSLIKLKLKKVEGRLNKSDFAKMHKNDIIYWTNNDFGPDRTIKTIITKINKYVTFKEYLENETLKKTLPCMDNINDGLSVYYKYFTKEDEQKYGIVAVSFKLINLN